MSLLGPVGDRSSFHDLSANIGTIIFQPIWSDGSKFILTLATPIMFRIFNIRPSISCKGNWARVINSKRRIGKQTHLISLWRMMLISFGLDVPVVIIGKIPCHDGLIVNETDVYRILETTAPDWWGLIINHDEQKCKKENLLKVKCHWLLGFLI